MFGISFGEIALVFVVALIVFGPEKLPEIARSFGRLSGELKRSSDRVRREFYNSVYVPAADLNKTIDTAARNLVATRTSSLQEPPETVGETPAQTKEQSRT